jgi:hypothetical protein
MRLLSADVIKATGRDQHECSELDIAIKDSVYRECKATGLSVAYECNDGTVSAKVIEEWGE